MSFEWLPVSPTALLGRASTWTADQTFNDNVKLLFGTGGDSAIYFDGVDTIWDLQVVGTGDLVILAAGTLGTPSKGAATVLTVQRSGTGGSSSVVSIIGGATGSSMINFGDTNDEDAGRLRYNHDGDKFEFLTATVARLFYSAAAFAFQEATVISTTTGDLDLTPNGNVVMGSPLNYDSAASLTIASGVVVITKCYHTLVVEGGAGAGADTLVTATGGVEGDILVLKTTTSGANDQVTVQNGTGSDTFILAGGADFVLDHIDDRIVLIHNGTEWVELSRSSNS